MIKKSICIPRQAAVLLMERGLCFDPEETYNKFLHDGVISTTEIDTFCMLITPIKQNDTGQQVGYVGYWENKMVTVSSFRDDMSELLCVIDWTDKGYPPNSDECVEIYEKALELFQRYKVWKMMQYGV